jgi:hypothetical protein
MALNEYPIVFNNGFLITEGAGVYFLKSIE